MVETVGSTFGDYMAQTTTSNPITWAEAFPIVNGLTTKQIASWDPTSMDLQLNTSTFPVSTQLCAGSSNPANCVGWEQFLYIPGGLLIEFWLLNYNNSCDAIGWQTYLPGGGTIDCYKNSDSAPTPFEPPTNLQNLTVMGQSGSTNDTAFFSSGNDSLYAEATTSLLGLNNGGWTSAEFNIFGFESGSQAVFNNGVVMVVQTLTNMKF